MSRPPYKLIVWGPGGLGTVAIYEISQRKDLALVGVRCYSDSKSGQDAGVLAGIGPVGVKASNDVKALLAIDCDCIIYTPRDFGVYNNDDEILMLLRAGKNVITALPYQHFRFTREASFVQKMNDACREGSSVFYATGVDPDVISDRLLASITGLCADIKSIKLQEFWDSQGTPAETLVICGFGQLAEEAQKNVAAAQIAANFLLQVCHGVGHALGVKYTRVTTTHDYVTTLQAVTVPGFTIDAGKVGRVVHRGRGYLSGAEPFFEIEVNWHIGPETKPVGAGPNQYWRITIDGRPAITVDIDVRSSLHSTERMFQMGAHRSEPGYHATVAACLQSVPLVCQAPPGVMEAPLPAIRWRPDLRDAAR